MGILGLTKLLGDHAPGCMKEQEIKNYFGKTETLFKSLGKTMINHDQHCMFITHGLPCGLKYDYSVKYEVVKKHPLTIKHPQGWKYTSSLQF